MDSSALSNAEFWLSVLHTARILAGILVTVGVAIELFGDWASTPFEKTVNDAKELKLKTLENEASSAKTELAEAQRKIAEANKIANTAAADAGKLGVNVNNLHSFVTEKERVNNSAIEELKKSTAGLDKARDDALKAAQESGKVLADMNVALEKERAVRQQMIDAMKPRTFSPVQRANFIKHLSLFSGIKATVWRFQTTSTDSDVFANEIVGLLRESKWEASGVSIGASGSAKGITVLKRIGATKQIENAVSAFINEMKSNNLPSGGWADFSGDGTSLFGGAAFNVFGGNPDVIIVVGDK